MLKNCTIIQSKIITKRWLVVGIVFFYYTYYCFFMEFGTVLEASIVIEMQCRHFKRLGLKLVK